MISFLRGALHYKKPPFLIIDLNGIGYECQGPLSTFHQLPDVGQEVFLYTHFSVREDAQVLYAFFREQERALFRSLIKISSVGPKLALAILSGIEVEHFVKCILEQDIHALVHIPGVGKKTAERLVIEMKDLLKDWGFEHIEVSPLKTKDRIGLDAVDALLALGYKPLEASKLVANVKSEYHSAEDLIRLALKNTLKGGKNDKIGSVD